MEIEDHYSPSSVTGYCGGQATEDEQAAGGLGTRFEEVGLSCPLP